MIKVVMVGGIGNLMFQAAFIKSLGIDNNSDYGLCIEKVYDHSNLRPEGGNYIGVNVLKDRTHYYVRSRYLTYFKDFHIFTGPVNVSGKQWPDHWSESIPFIPNALYESGFFNYKLFDHNKEKIRFPIDTLNALKYLHNSNIDPDNLSIIHIRAGDYITTGDMLSSVYFNEASNRIPMDKNTVIVTTDADIAQRIFPNFHHSQMSDIDEMALMTLAKHIVISNSSFSWWGAYLSNAETIILPSNWFHDVANDPLACPGWISV